MPLAPNSLLQVASNAKAQKASANSLAATTEPSKDNASSFAQVYAKESKAPSVKVADNSPKVVRDKNTDVPAKKDAVADAAANSSPVADSGKPLPADAATAGADGQAASDDSATDDAAAVADVLPADPTLDPQLVAAVLTPPVAPPVEAVAAPQPEVPVPVIAAVAASVQAAGDNDPSFDPEADPLDALPALRLAMEQSGHVSASSQNTQKAPAEPEQTPAQAMANGVALLVDPKGESDSTEHGGEKLFKGLIEDGLKDLKSATSDTRIDDFANRLAALTQAATPKTANVVPVTQPLVMNQSGWTEEVVNRVMYLSSANLKSADIQLEPAELGRLDIRVNMATDQATQISFVSGHAGVREALEGQMFRLRDMLAQQGMGQAEVNVSDQSGAWQQQQGRGQDQAHEGQRRSGGNGDRVDGADDGSVAAATDPVSPSVVIGSSAVDYYA